MSCHAVSHCISWTIRSTFQCCWVYRLVCVLVDVVLLIINPMGYYDVTSIMRLCIVGERPRGHMFIEKKIKEGRCYIKYIIRESMGPRFWDELGQKYPLRPKTPYKLTNITNYTPNAMLRVDHTRSNEENLPIPSAYSQGEGCLPRP